MEQSSIKFVAGALAFLLLVPTLAGMQKADAAAAAGIMVPLYTYPGATWDTVIETKNDHPGVPVVAIVNPASGPGGARDSNYVSGIDELKDAGVIVLGYVSTAYTGRSLDAVRGDIDRWDSWYDVDGIFFDEQTNWAGGESYYNTAGNYAESKGLDFTVGNPGANSIPSYLSTVDVVLIYESPGLPNLNNYDDTWAQYDNAQLGMIPFSVGSMPTGWINDATEFIGWLYVTHDSLPNPWDSLPPYYDDMAAMLDDGSGPASSPAPEEPEHQLTVRSVDSAGMAISGMWMEVKQGGATVHTGFTPLSLTLEESTYTVSAGSYQQILFSRWQDGSTSSTTTVKLSGDSQVTAHYGSGSTQQAPQPSTLTVRTVDESGSPLTGYHMVLSQNGATVGTAFSPASFTLAGGQTYQVSVSDYGDYAFDHWNDGSTSRQKSVTGGQAATLTAHYESTAPQEATLTVESVDLDGERVTGLWTVIRENGATVRTGYTPLEHAGLEGSTYEVSVSDYGDYEFESWEGGSESRTMRVTLEGDTTLTAMYSTVPEEPEQVTLTIRSVGLDGSPITGLWTVIGGSASATGFTPLSFTADAGSQYTVTMGEYRNYVFDHWDTGSTSKSRTVTPNSDATLTAYYRQ
jgi:hypothetical protein